MDFTYSKDKITIEKELNKLDDFVIDFTKFLNSCNITYAVVSGYVAILFGRSRGSEDIDIIIDKISFGEFEKLWNMTLNSEFECIITSSPKEAYDDYLMENLSIRFARKNNPIPNVEIMMSSDALDEWSIKNKILVILNNNRFYISPLELQISYKLYLGSEKDIEDARHLFKIFKGKLNIMLLNNFNQKLKIEKLFKRYLE